MPANPGTGVSGRSVPPSRRNRNIQNDPSIGIRLDVPPQGDGHARLAKDSPRDGLRQRAITGVERAECFSRRFRSNRFFSKGDNRVGAARDGVLPENFAGMDRHLAEKPAAFGCTYRSRRSNVWPSSDVRY